MKKVSLFLTCFMVFILSSLNIQPVRAGGWAVVTLEEWPEQMVAERPFPIRFSVRQHGPHLLEGLSPTVTAVHAITGDTVTVKAAETKDAGFYAASLALPTTGEWHWTITAFSYMNTMPPLSVQAASGTIFNDAPVSERPYWSLTIGISGMLAAVGMTLVWRRQPGRLRLTGMMVALIIGLVGLGWYGQRPSTLAAQLDVEQTAVGANSVPLMTTIEQGEALFVAKGCIQCHQNGNVKIADTHFSIGPNLTKYKAKAEFLRLWLADPASIKPETLMPNLGLSDTEIEVLIAFLNPGSTAE